MGRTLEALRQIEGRGPQPALPTPPPGPCRPAVMAAVGDVEAESSSPVAVVVAPAEEDLDGEHLAGDRAIEAALARAQSVAEMVAGEVAGEETVGGDSAREEIAGGEPPADERPPEEFSVDPSAEADPATLRPTARPATVEASRRLAYGELAERILAQLPPDRPAVLMFTSAADEERKTSALASLAAALAERMDDELLLVDANVRRPELASQLDVEASVGLADVLMGVSDWRFAVRTSSLPRVHVLPGSRIPTHDGRPPEVLNLKALFADLAAAYRLVLVDTASLAHREVAPIGRYCWGVYLVVRLGHATRRGVRAAVRAVDACGGRMLGCVVLGD